jgi:hypothetical protein
MVSWVRHNAAWLAGMLTAAVAVATAFGLKLSAEQVSAITGLVAAITGGLIHVDSWRANGK